MVKFFHDQKFKKKYKYNSFLKKNSKNYRHYKKNGIKVKKHPYDEEANSMERYL